MVDTDGLKETIVDTLNEHKSVGGTIYEDNFDRIAELIVEKWKRRDR